MMIRTPKLPSTPSLLLKTLTIYFLAANRAALVEGFQFVHKYQLAGASRTTCVPHSVTRIKTEAPIFQRLHRNKEIRSTSANVVVDPEQEWREDVVSVSEDKGKSATGGDGAETDDSDLATHTQNFQSHHLDNPDEVISDSSGRKFRRESLMDSETYCGSDEVIFNFEAFPNGEIARDITYKANMQIKEIIKEDWQRSRGRNFGHGEVGGNGNSRPGSHRPSRAVMAKRILDRLEELGRADTITYNLVINAFAKSSVPDSANRAEKILTRMQKIYQKQLAKSVEGEDQIDPDIPLVKPNVRTYSTVIDAYSRTSTLEGAEVAQSLLEKLRMLHQSTGDEELKPNVISYNSVINAWAKTGTLLGAEKALKLLDVMEEGGIADVISYNAVIHAWARCGSKECGDMAESILKRMKKKYENEQKEEVAVVGNGADQGSTTFIYSPSIRPNFRSYSSVIDAWSRSTLPNAPRRAEAILDEMEKAYFETRDTSIQPNTVTYSSVINAHARSRDMENKAVAALQVLKRMQEVYNSGVNKNAQPSIVSYNSVLNACATTYGTVRRYKSQRRDDDEDEVFDQSSDLLYDDAVEEVISESQSLALGIVKMLYTELINSNSEIHPDHFTYGTVLKACANLMSPGDDEATTFIREVFEQCCEDGQVSFGVCFQLRQASPVDLYRELIPEEAMDVTNGHFLIDRMPSYWSRNLKEKRRFIKK